jgi:hypothetical protein
MMKHLLAVLFSLLIWAAPAYAQFNKATDADISWIFFIAVAVDALIAFILWILGLH